MASTSHRKDVRINLRSSDVTKALLQRAANIESGGDLSAFVLTQAAHHAHDVLRTQEVVDLQPEVRERFYALLLDPPEPGPALKRLFADPPSKRYRLVP